MRRIFITENGEPSVTQSSGHPSSGPLSLRSLREHDHAWHGGHGRCVEGRSDEEKVGELRGRVLAAAIPRGTDDPLAPGQTR